MDKLQANLVHIDRNSNLGISVSSVLSNPDIRALNFPEYAVFPGFCDVHVHFREPGFSYKETIVSGAYASARGGYTAVCTMPNLNPVPDSVENLGQQLKLIEDGACIHVYPYGAITVGEKGDLAGSMASQGTTPRRLTDLIGSLCDLTSGSGDKGTPIILVQGYFDNYTN